MPRLVACVLVVACLHGGPAFAKGGGHSGGTTHNTGPVHVNGYYTKNGTYVSPYDRTAPNGTKNDNWSTQGNVNPETGQPGTKPGDAGNFGGQPPVIGECRWIRYSNGEEIWCTWNGTRWVRYAGATP
ncbi:MAG: hypothetical protein JWM80_1262 [Cyanobacteria bacterium RYN_339]|nr:hypothetical protein [Cyanobacteria bacterium RYN_339]